MISVKVIVKESGRPAKGQKVVLSFDGEQGTLPERYTDRYGVARFEARAGSGKVLVNDFTRRDCHIDWYTEVALWSTI